jgi:hypothetical protein
MNYQNGHSVRLDLGPELRSGLIKYMAKHDLDREFAALQLFIKSLQSEGMISREVYEFYISRYSRTISSMSLTSAPAKSIEQVNHDAKLAEKDRLFEMVLSQWDLSHKPGWKEGWLKQAEKHPDLPNAKKLLDKFREKVFVSKNSERSF